MKRKLIFWVASGYGALCILMTIGILGFSLFSSHTLLPYFTSRAHARATIWYMVDDPSEVHVYTDGTMALEVRLSRGRNRVLAPIRERYKTTGLYTLDEVDWVRSQFLIGTPEHIERLARRAWGYRNQKKAGVLLIRDLGFLPYENDPDRSIWHVVDTLPVGRDPSTEGVHWQGDRVLGSFPAERVPYKIDGQNVRLNFRERSPGNAQVVRYFQDSGERAWGAMYPFAVILDFVTLPIQAVAFLTLLILLSNNFPGV